MKKLKVQILPEIKYVFIRSSIFIYLLNFLKTNEVRHLIVFLLIFKQIFITLYIHNCLKASK